MVHLRILWAPWNFGKSSAPNHHFCSVRAVHLLGVLFMNLFQDAHTWLGGINQHGISCHNPGKILKINGTFSPNNRSCVHCVPFFLGEFFEEFGSTIIRRWIWGKISFIIFFGKDSLTELLIHFSLWKAFWPNHDHPDHLPPKENSTTSPQQTPGSRG